MAYFHTITAIKNADIEQLTAVKGVTEANAKAIKEFYQATDNEADVENNN